MTLSHGAVLSITCSIGFAPWPFSAAWPALGDWQQTSALADRCLYAAKAAEAKEARERTWWENARRRFVPEREAASR